MSTVSLSKREVSELVKNINEHFNILWYQGSPARSIEEARKRFELWEKTTYVIPPGSSTGSNAPNIPKKAKGYLQRLDFALEDVTKTKDTAKLEQLAQQINGHLQELEQLQTPAAGAELQAVSGASQNASPLHEHIQNKVFDEAKAQHGDEIHSGYTGPFSDARMVFRQNEARNKAKAMYGNTYIEEGGKSFFDD